MQNEIIP